MAQRRPKCECGHPFSHHKKGRIYGAGRPWGPCKRLVYGRDAGGSAKNVHLCKCSAYHPVASPVPETPE
jgi:hypothetical protein